MGAGPPVPRVQNLKGSNPVMAEQFWLEFNNAEEVNAAADVLEAVTVDGEKAFTVIRDKNALFTGFGIRKQLGKDSVMHSPAANRTSKFFDIFYTIEGIKSGMHHQDGLLWIRNSRVPGAQHSRVALESIAPTILELLGVPIPSHLMDPSLLKTAVPERELAGVSA